MILLTRLHPTEPLLKPRDLEWEKHGILNPGVTIYDNKILLLYRAVGTDGVSRLGVATTGDGLNFQYTSDEPTFVPDPQSKYEERGVEDPRITVIDDKYAIVYVAASINKTLMRPNAIDWKTRVSLAWTTDFKTFDRHGVILHSYNDKNAALFPVKWQEKQEWKVRSDGPNEQVENYYYLYHRRYPSIWLSKSRDLNTWEDVCDEIACMVITPNTTSWDSDRVGIGSQPIYTDDGWLTFYHGRDKNGVYRLGAMLSEFEKPENLISKLPYPLIEPQLPFETNGPIPNVIFTCGAVEAGDQYWVYYGGADFAIGGAYIEKKALLNELKHYAEPAANLVNVLQTAHQTV